MFAYPINNNLIAAIDDRQSEDWVFHFVEIEPFQVETYQTPHGGSIVSATVNPESFATWIIASGHLFASSREMQVAVRLPLPIEGLVPFDVTLLGERYYVCGDASNIWFYDVPAEKWVAVSNPEKRPALPPRGETESAKDYTRRTSAASYQHARSYPDIYKAFSVGNDHYFVGALGRVLRLREDDLTGEWIDSGIRFLHGFAEDSDAILCGSGSVAEIYKGNFETGFELIFQDDNPALFLMATHDGVRYIGAGLHPDHEGPCLFVLDTNGDLAVVETACAREPEQLRHLVSHSSSLLAIDEHGVFRLKEGRWSLTEFSDFS